jgi:hypothetical protein
MDASAHFSLLESVIGESTFSSSWKKYYAVQGQESEQFILILCNSIGSPVDSKYIKLEPLFLAMNSVRNLASKTVFVKSTTTKTGTD